MKINTLREFVYLSEELNYSSTARHFFINQSALSRHIMDLESELGCELFIRNRRSVRLTRAGKALADRAPELIALHDAIAAEVPRAMLNQKQCVNVGYLQGAVAPYLETGIKLFKRDYPDIRVKVRSMQPCEIEEALKKDAIDIGITMMPKDDVSPLFHCALLYEDRFALMMDKGNPLASRDEVAPAELDRPVYYADSFPHEPRLAALLQQRLAEAGVETEPRGEIDDVESMPLLFEGQNWICLSCQHLEHVFSPRFKIVPLKGVDLSFDINIAWKKTRQSALNQNFADCLAYSYGILAKA